MSPDAEAAPATEESAPAETTFAAAVPELAGIPALTVRGQELLFPAREHYVTAVAALRANGFVTCSDVTAVDYLRHGARPLPPPVLPERFEVVAGLLSHEHRRRIRVRVQIPESDPVCPSLFGLYPGTENMEREVYDMFGIRFVGHPDMTRILMPEDWEGHPLRKDYGIGRVPVQFKDAPGPR